MTRQCQPSRVRATKEGIQKLRDARDSKRDDDGKRLTNPRIAEKIGVEESTVKRFFREDRVYRDNASAICKVLGLKLEDVVDLSELDPPTEIPELEQSSANAIVTELRNRCREMLNDQKRLTVDLLTGGDGLPFNALDFVPLGLLEQQKLDGRGSNPDYEVREKFDRQEEFFNQVLREGQKSPRSQAKRLAIIGESGAGKTTLLLTIGLWVLDNTEDIPIWISLADVGKKPLDHYLKDDWLRKIAGRLAEAPPDWVKELEQRLESGQVWLLLDGVDSHPLPEILKQLTGWAKNTRVVLTCRTSTWNLGKEALKVFDFDTYKSLGFSSAQVKQFITRFFSSDRKMGERLQTELNQPRQERLRDLVKYPFHLTVLCRNWQQGRDDLPNTKAELYRGFIARAETKCWKLIERLGELARQTLNLNQKQFALSLVSKKLGKPDESLFQLALQLGWLKCVDAHKQVYAFLHDAFQEYFAAQAIPNWRYFLNHNPHNLALGTYRIFEPQWKEVILLWLGREDMPKEQKEEFIKGLVKFEDGCENFYRDRAYFLAAAGLAEFGECSLADTIIAQLVDWGFGNFRIEKHAFNDQKRGYQISLIWEMPLSDSLAYQARAALQDSDRSKVVSFLTEKLDIYRNIWNVDPYLLAAYNQGQIDAGTRNGINTHARELRVLVAYNLGKINAGNPDAIDTLTEEIDALIEELRTSEDITLKTLSAHNVGKALFCVMTACRLFEIHPDNPNAIKAIKILTAWLLGQEIDLSINDIIRSFSFLNFSLIDRTSWQYTWNSLQAASGNRDTYQQNNIIAPEELIARTLLNHVLSDAPEQIVVSVRDADKRDPLELAIELLHTSKDKFLLCGLAFRLGKFCAGNSEVASALIHLLRTHQDSDIRLQATYSLKAILQENLFPVVVSALKNCLQDSLRENDVDLYRRCDGLLWYCAQNMAHPDFYRAWNGEPSIVEALENQITDIASGLQPTAQTYPIAINAQALELEADSRAIAQELCTQIYLATNAGVPPFDVDSAIKLKPRVLEIRKHLQKHNLALILYGCQPYQKLVEFCRQQLLPGLDKVLHISWITDKPLEPPLKGFPSEQPNLLSAIQSWINEIA